MWQWNVSPTTFRLSAGVDRSEYRHGDTVRISGTACSTSFWWFREGVGGGGGVHVRWHVLDASGQTVADNSHQILTTELRTQVWWPRQCRDWQDDWDLRYWNRPDQPRSFAGPARGDAVPPGSYRAEATWQVRRRQPPSNGTDAAATHTALSEPFEVRPPH